MPLPSPSLAAFATAMFFMATFFAVLLVMLSLARTIGALPLIALPVTVCVGAGAFGSRTVPL